MTDTATNSRELELVVLGATGFTGRQAAQWFSRWASANRPELRWAIAARNSERLQAVAETLSDGPTPTQIVLDTADEQGCRALAERTSTLLTTVGPYARYGSHVIAACAQAGTDYVDITGETPWVRQMLDAHQDAALASGAKIVPLCGFDSIPSDVGAYLVCRALQAAGTEPTAVKSNYSIKGGFNGGTLASALNMMELKQGRALYHPHLLTPKAGRAHLSDRQPRDVQPPRYDEEMETWVTPFIMAPINTRVVRRSAALLGMRGQGYGDKFQYSEFMRTRSAVQAWTVTSALGTINWLGRSGWGRGLLKRFGPAPGQGPSEETMDGGFFKARFWGRGADGQVVRAVVGAAGDPGNRVTVNLLCTCATLLMERRDELPEGAGFLTPMSAFGEALIEAMHALDMTAKVEGL